MRHIPCLDYSLEHFQGAEPLQQNKTQDNRLPCPLGRRGRPQDTASQETQSQKM